MTRNFFVFQSQASAANAPLTVIVDLRLSADPPANPQQQKKFQPGPLIVIIGYNPAMLGGPGPFTLRNRAGAIIAQASPTNVIGAFFTVGSPIPFGAEIINGAQVNAFATLQKLCLPTMPEDDFLQIDLPAGGAGIVSRIAVFGLSPF